MKVVGLILALATGATSMAIGAVPGVQAAPATVLGPAPGSALVAPVTNGAIVGDKFPAADLWKGGKGALVFVVRRPG